MNQPRSTPVTEHVIIDALEGIRIVRDGSLDSEVKGPGFSTPIDPNVLQKHKLHRLHLLSGGFDSNDRSLAQETPEPSLARFVVVKLRSWLVGYTRILSLHSSYFTTLDPDTFQVTNKWTYRHIRSISPSLEHIECVIIDVVTEKGTTHLKLKCLPHDRTEVLSKLFELSYYDDSKFILRSKNSSAYTNVFVQNTFFKECHRQTRFNTRQQTSLLCTSHGLIELDYESLCPLKTYFYKDIFYFNFLSDETSGIMIHFDSSAVRFPKLFFISSSRIGGNGRSDLISVIREKYTALGITFSLKESSTLQEYLHYRRSIGSRNILGEKLRSFKVMKLSGRLKNKTDACYIERCLSMTDKGYLVECDCDNLGESRLDKLQTSVIRCLNLTRLRSITRSRDVATSYEPVGLEFIDSTSRTYILQNRDSFLASICDALEVFHALNDTDLSSYRLSSKSNVIAEKICLKRLHQVCSAANVFIQVSSVSALNDCVAIDPVDECLVVVDACYYFIVNCGQSIARNLHDETKMVISVIQSLWALISRLTFYDYSKVSSMKDRFESLLIPILQTLYLLITMSTTYSYMIGVSTDTAATFKQLFGLIHDPMASFWLLKILSTYALPCEATYDLYKGVILDSVFDGLIDRIATQKSRELPLVVASSIVEMLLHSHRFSTSNIHLTSLTRYISPRVVLKMLQNKIRLVVENAFIFLQIINMYSEHSAYEMRECLLRSGYPLLHFYLALYCPLESQRFFSRLVCGFCFSGSDSCHGKMLLKRLIPSGFLVYLSLPALSAQEEEELDNIDNEYFELSADFMSFSLLDLVTGIDTLRLRTKLSYFATERYPATSSREREDNFRILFHTMRFDHELPDLIWNKETRNELKVSLETELMNIHRQNNPDNIIWNFHAFSVSYQSLLNNEVKVGSIYLRVFLQAGDSLVAKSLSNPRDLFEAIFRRFLFAWDRDWEIVKLCIPCLNRLYRLHHLTIGTVSEHVAIILRLTSITSRVNVQHELLSLITSFIDTKNDETSMWSPNIHENAQQLMNLDSFSVICEFVILAHTTFVDYHKIWCIAPPVGTAPNDNPLRGPFNLSDLRKLLTNHEICTDSVVCAGFCDENQQCYYISSWDPLDSIWELRTRNGTNIDISAAKELSLTALNIIFRLLTLQNSVDENGNIFTPIPVVKQLMNGSLQNIFISTRPSLDVDIHVGTSPLHPSSFLPIVFECIFSNDAQIVDEVIAILRVLLQYNNDGCERFYKSGFFHFVLVLLGRIRQLCPRALTKIVDIYLYVSSSIESTDNIFDNEVLKECEIVVNALTEYISKGEGCCSKEMCLIKTYLEGFPQCKDRRMSHAVVHEDETITSPKPFPISPGKYLSNQKTIPNCPPSYDPPSPPND